MEKCTDYSHRHGAAHRLRSRALFGTAAQTRCIRVGAYRLTRDARTSSLWLSHPARARCSPRSSHPTRKLTSLWLSRKASSPALPEVARTTVLLVVTCAPASTGASRLTWAIITGTSPAANRYQTVADLRGSPVGVSRIGSGSQLMASVLALREYVHTANQGLDRLGRARCTAQLCRCVVC